MDNDVEGERSDQKTEYDADSHAEPEDPAFSSYSLSSTLTLADETDSFWIDLAAHCPKRN